MTENLSCSSLTKISTARITMIVPTRLRSEARAKGRDDFKRVISSYALQQVRRWEKHWITITDTSIRVHKWMPCAVLDKDLVTTRTKLSKLQPTSPTETSSQVLPTPEANDTQNSLTQDTQMIPSPQDQESTQMLVNGSQMTVDGSQYQDENTIDSLYSNQDSNQEVWPTATAQHHHMTQESNDTTISQ
ncbi:unnamed protein product [Didymodactylos carnosus]|uniref:Uncharacterized protein n=1 Tax=Didymodactylos carnosus TaxID=1234261 RepID=A0A813PXC7_9BILA|nr:unnamed protein product [Didymodactylos carnosus]CAF1135432.1 unnamed protein product [Didymodactylos carnosus]CAF3538105.1 unnamed protein product [Didymodactylos carnosus]CAF3923804.1 unnamed protein product [Didymodactylos carnosus]